LFRNHLDRGFADTHVPQRALISWSADLIAIIALLGSARFFQVLAVSMSDQFRRNRIEPRGDDCIAGRTRNVDDRLSLALIAVPRSSPHVRLHEFTGGWFAGFAGPGLIALTIVAIARTRVFPVDNPATHLELTMVHEAMVLEYPAVISR